MATPPKRQCGGSPGGSSLCHRLKKISIEGNIGEWVCSSPLQQGKLTLKLLNAQTLCVSELGVRVAGRLHINPESEPFTNQ